MTRRGHEGNVGHGHGGVLRGLRNLSALAGSWALCVCAFPACVDRLPAEDRRITAVQPSAKLSAADLWQDYQQDAAAANRKYFGEPVEVSGKVTGIDPSAAGAGVVMFGQTETLGIRAILLGDQAVAILKDAKVNERLTLKCFVEGKSLEGNVGLRSCIRP